MYPIWFGFCTLIWFLTELPYKLTEFEVVDDKEEQVAVASTKDIAVKVECCTAAMV